MSELFAACNQWMTRPADERFWNLADMEKATGDWQKRAITSQPTPFSTLRTEVQDGELCLTGRTGKLAPFTNYGFGQVCTLSGAPAKFMRELPTTLASQVLNNRLKVRGENDSAHDARILFHAREDQSLVVRSVNTDLYDRVWNVDLIRRLRPMVEVDGWMVPPGRPAFKDPRARPATEADIIPGQDDFGLSVRVGDMIAPSGLYASDHDMFVFLVNPERVLKAGNRQLMRGFFVRNSEVGDGSLRFDFFCMDNVCGNHIVWGASDVHSIKIRHVGTETLAKGLKKFAVELTKYSDARASEQEEQIAKAMRFELGKSKDEVLDAVFKYARSHSLPAITRKRIEAAYDTVASERGQLRYGDNPRTVWAMVSGLTENSQGEHADTRDIVDTQAGRLLEIAF